ncbi:MAG: heme lyase CcmF/NrfE family subunit [Pseudomonadota bacterium]
MTPELGLFALAMALMMAVFQTAAPLAGAARGDRAVARLSGPAAIAQFFLVAFAFAALTASHVQSDFSVRNVVENSHTDKPMIYKFTGVWGNHEGSMLMWVLILAGFGAALALRRGGDDSLKSLKSMTLSIQGAVAAAFLAFLIFTSNPFARLFPAPQNGMDLNPLLQDPGLAIHPPFLYLGYVGFSIVFAFAVAALIKGEVDAAWARAVRPWALAAWVFLTIGIALGSWWAYYELGWGGFWAWDPVENASFLPWLAGTAFIHSVRVLEKRETLKVWTVLLAIAAFSLSLIGTFLVRSGIITSVHSFAVDPTRGVFILMILAAVIGGSLLLFAIRAPLLTSRATFKLTSREGAILINNLLMTAACVTVFLGTFYPLFVDILTGERLSVGAPYFNATFLPLMAVLLLILAPMSALGWKRGDVMQAVLRLWPVAIVAAVTAVLALVVAAPKETGTVFGVALAAWAGGGSIAELVRRSRVRAASPAAALKNAFRLPRPFLGMTAAHVGVAILAIGVIGAGAWRSDKVLYMKPGDTVSVGGYEVRLDAVRESAGQNYATETAHFSLMENGAAGRVITAERRYYPVRRMQTTEAGIWTTFFGDLYLTVGEPSEGRGHAVRVWYNPFAVWLWIGSAFVAFGGVVAAAPTRQPRELAQPAHPSPSSPSSLSATAIEGARS